MENLEWGRMMKKRDVTTRLDELEKIFNEESFRKNKGLGNEVGYHVFDYSECDELQVRSKIQQWKQQYTDELTNFRLDVFDLYDIVIDYLEKKNYIQQFIDFEKEEGFEEINIAIDEMLGMDEDDDENMLLEYISSRVTDHSIVFLTGIGKCFPFLRSHKVLNNMHQYIDHVPVVMFYPGEYDGQSLQIFSRVKDDNYYRAFKLIE